MPRNIENRGIESRGEEPQTPDYLQPTVRLVNATLGSVHRYLDQTSKYVNLTSHQQALQTVLSETEYDCVRVSAQELRQSLTPFTEKNIGSTSTDSLFRDLVGDLEYVSLLEKGGLDAVNVRLKELQDSLGTELSDDQKDSVLGQMNTLLGRAIYLFPHVASGIAVTLKPGVETRNEAFEEKYGWLDYHRNGYDQLKKAYSQSDMPFPDSFVFPLPYGFTTGTHGSGERAAMACSWEDVYWKSIYYENNWSKKTPTLAVALKDPLGLRQYTHFTFDEVESVQFTPDRDFTPYVNVDRRDISLVEKGNSEWHYLRFRDFSRKPIIDGKPDEVTDEEWKRARCEMINAEHYSNLWITLSGILRDRLQRGFLASSVNDAVTLYELTDVRLPHADFAKSAVIFYTKILRGDKKFRKHVQSYTGESVIKRLVEIPVDERHF